MSKNSYLDAMGIQVWKPRRVLPLAKELHSSSLRTVDENYESSDDWSVLQQQVSQCTACQLHTTRTNTIFGMGNLDADWMIIGDAPDEGEEIAGEPFVGTAGQMLNQMLLAIGVSREEVYLVNILKCRPPNNRDPKKDEVESCHHYLIQQINRVKPKVILALGRVASQQLLKTKETIGHLRDNNYTLEDVGIALVPTFHPAYLLRSPMGKSKVWEDLVRAKKLIDNSQ